MMGTELWILALSDPETRQDGRTIANRPLGGLKRVTATIPIGQILANPSWFTAAAESEIFVTGYRSMRVAALDLPAPVVWLNPSGIGGDDLENRTLTELYNRRPPWLADAHDDLDRAVLDAYGWPPDLDDEALLGRLLALNLERPPV